MESKKSALFFVALILSSRNSIASNVVHWIEKLAQHPDLLQDVRFDQQFFLARAGAVDIDGRIDAFFRHAPVKVDFHVAGTLEFLIDHIIHARAGIDQRGGDDGKRAAFLDISGGAKKTFGALQGVGVDAARQIPCRMRALPYCMRAPDA